MTLGVISKKIGMTGLIADNGAVIPVTVLQVVANRVVQIKSSGTDGYHAVQVAANEQSVAKINNCVAGHYAKAKVKPGTVLREFRVDEAQISQLELGQTIAPDMFKVGELVDVQAKSKGKGFAGVVKRHNFHMQDATHGNSLSHRAPGSIGQCQYPGKVFKGKKMAGHMGMATCTVQSQEIVQIDTEHGLILLKGAVPGAKGSLVMVRPSVKAKGETDAN